MDALVPWAGALAICLALVLVVWAVAGTRPNAAARANAGVVDGAFVDLRQRLLDAPVGGRVVAPALVRFGRWFGAKLPAGVIDELDRKLKRSGLAGRWSIDQVVLAKVMLAGVGALIGLGALAPNILAIGRAVFLPIFGWKVIDVVLRIRADRRRDEVRRTLPDFLDQLLVTVEAGMAFESAVARVAADGKGLLSEEVSRTLQDMRLGTPRQEAFEGLAERLDVADVRSFVNAMGQAAQNGVPIGRVLRAQAAEQRARRKNFAEEKAQKIQVKIIFPVVLFLLPAIFIVVLGPAAITIVDTFGGS